MVIHKKKERTPLQIAQHRFWADLGTCARTRANLLAMPQGKYKGEALQYIVRIEKIIRMNYEAEKARLLEERAQLKAEGCGE